MAADKKSKSDDNELEFDFGSDDVTDTKIDNLDSNNDNLDHLDLDDDFNLDDLNLDFDEEEKADEEELNNIQQRKKDKLQDQPNPFDNEINNNASINTDINNTNIENISKSVIQIDDNILSDDNALFDDKVQSDIIKMDEEIDNINLFMKHMEKQGYQFESSRFLTKKFAESSDMDTIYNINITINNEVITAITGYDNNNKIIAIPDSIITTVQNDIQEALKQII